MRYSYYYNLNIRVLRFLIPEKKDILYYGYYNRDVIKYLKPSYMVYITEEHVYDTVERADIICSPYKNFIPQKKFDYVVLDVALGCTDDMCLLLNNVLQACTEYTRVILHQENYLWQPLLKLCAKLGLKNKEATKNWLSVGDIHTYLKSNGFEQTRTFSKNIFPVRLLFVGPLLNSLAAFIPLFDFLKLDQFIVARALLKPKFPENPSLTICLTVRDEGENIASIVNALPNICEKQEILFVEGHSSDNTVDEIKKMQLLYPKKNIRLVHQDGIGQGDAIRKGFNDAGGEIIILYEGDGTSETDDIQYFYQCMKEGWLEFIEGSRLSYPTVSESMPFINKIGNVLFATWFTLFLRQRSTDVLSGIKAIKKKHFELIYNSWGFLNITDPFGDFELLFGSARYGLKIGEIPMRYKCRKHGVSKTNVFKHGLHLIKMAWKGYFVFRNTKVNMK